MRLFICIHAQEVFFFLQIRSIKKPVKCFKNGRKKLFSLQNVMKKLFETHYSLKKLSASPRNGNPPIKE